MTERNQEAQQLAEKVVSGGIVQKATERLVYQIVEVCAEHERENTDALRARVAKLEAALREARGWVINFDNPKPFQHHATLTRIDDALGG